MMPGGTGLGVAAVATSPGPSPLPANFVTALQGAAEAGQYLVEIVAYKGGEPRSGGLWTIAEGPIAAVEGGVGVTVGAVTLRYADRHWVGDPSADSQANVFYEGRVVVPLSVSRRMPVLPEEPRRGLRQFGEVVFANGDGAMDPIVQSYAIDGRRIKVLFGPAQPSDYGDFRTVADVLGVAWSGDEGEVRLVVRDAGRDLDRPVQTTLYAGTGSDEGPAELEGKPKPLAFGRCRNITPVLLDASNLIYQVHDGAISDITDVYDQGLALTDSGTDVANYAALVAQSVTAGQFATCNAAGMFKLGQLPSGLVTADVLGDATPDYQNTLDTICLRILKTLHGLSAHLIDEASFAGAATIAGELGIYISPEETPSTAQVIDRLIGSTGGWWGAGRDGRIRAGRLTKPEDRSPNMYLRDHDIIDLRPEPTPVARWRQRVGFKPNWTIQRGEDLAATVTAARRQFLSAPHSVYIASDATVKTRHLSALDPPPLASLYENEADATTLADLLLALHTPDRQIFTCVTSRRALTLDLQKVVRIVSWPRYGLSQGKNFTVVGIEEQADAQGEEVVLTLWG